MVPLRCGEDPAWLSRTRGALRAFAKRMTRKMLSMLPPAVGCPEALERSEKSATMSNGNEVMKSGTNHVRR